ncbi:Uma2 family endonuclease [Lichenifustis flavocetrariae]|uniref:Uma2 family endonuclease n=1 Tax=Lichenifustis flavocetrariae TaxID=2949735 RepID=A0AA41Z2S1_9HYPH|nr:Uma2 family endonuclease [Lichenifustis flavocetrariae]MCW6508232.1 Uma2 family endonuclease [Lichenifustis flavocetrariae]
MSHLTDQFDVMDLDDFEELLADRPRDERWELIGGRVVKMMVGARWEHNIIAQNLAFGLRQRLRAQNSPCRVFLETFCMKNKTVESATLPDIMVHCGALPAGATSVDNPVVLIEVVSRGSAARDRVEKWGVYQRLGSLQHYVLVERDRSAIDVFDRAGEAWASLRTLEGLEAVLDLPALDVSLPLSEIYQDVLTT